MERVRLNLNPDKIKWLSVPDFSGFGYFLSLVLNVVSLPQAELIYNLIIHPDSQLLLKERWQLWPRKSLHRFN